MAKKRRRTRAQIAAAKLLDELAPEVRVQRLAEKLEQVEQLAAEKAAEVEALQDQLGMERDVPEGNGRQYNFERLADEVVAVPTCCPRCGADVNVAKRLAQFRIDESSPFYHAGHIIGRGIRREYRRCQCGQNLVVRSPIVPLAQC